jgi:hypothetical protein
VNLQKFKVSLLLFSYPICYLPFTLFVINGPPFQFTLASKIHLKKKKKRKKEKSSEKLHTDSSSSSSVSVSELSLHFGGPYSLALISDKD